MQIKVNGSHEVLRTFCQNVRVFVRDVIEERANENRSDLECEIISDICHGISFHQEAPIPLNHITIFTDDEEDEEMIEWIKQEPVALFEALYIQLAEIVVVTELEKNESLLAA